MPATVLQFLLFFLFLIAHSTATPLQSGEPAETFLNQLRAAGYFDLAIEYLDRLDTYPGIDAELKTAVRLEKAQTFIDAGVAARRVEQRDESFRQAESQLNEFLKSGTHPRHSQARMLLGRLQMVRAAQLQGSDSDDETKSQSRQSYLAAAETFDTIVKSLRATLKEMQGANIDASQEPEKVAQRDQFRGQFLEAIKNSGEARLLAAKTFADPAAQAQEILKKSLEKFSELSDKYESYVPGAIALAFQGEVQAALGDNDEALESFIRMLEQPDVDALREAKFRAAGGIIGIHMSAEPPKYQLAIDAGNPIAKDIRPNETAIPIVQSFRVALAEALLAKAADDKNQEPAAVRRAKAAGRELLVVASQLPGPVADKAAELLKTMGIEVAESSQPATTIEDPVDFPDALAKARQLLKTNGDLRNTLNLLKNQSADGASAERISEIEAQLQQLQQDAIGILRFGLGSVDVQSDPTSVNQARQILAYLLYQNQDYRAANVVGQFLARTAAGTETGLQGGLLALNSLQLLLAEDSENQSLASQLESLGTYLTGTWPDNPKAAAAQGTMLKLALKNGDYERATALIEKMPAGPDRYASLRLLGRILWTDSYRFRKDGKTEESQRAVESAQQTLQTGLEKLQDQQPSAEVIKSALTLAKVFLEQGQPAKAMQTLEHPKYGPLDKPDLPGLDSRFRNDLFSTELRIVVQQMTESGSDPNSLLDRATDVMEKLQKSVEGPDAGKRLSGIYLGMAKTIRDQLDRAEPVQRKKLVDAFRVFLERIASTTSQPATLQWAATTLIELAESSMAPNQIRAQGQAVELLKTAITALENLNQKQPSLTIDFQLSRAQRMLGNYKQSIDILAGLLQEKPMMLDAQIEAALAYEQWAAVVPPKFTGNAYKSALNGARPNANRENVIWGWGKVGQLTMRNADHQETFFDARYHVALCRFLWGKAVDDSRIVNKAVTDITRVHALHPDMGGPEMFTKFDQLLKAIQTELKQPPTGLSTPP